jgi:hypothetical protein
MISEVDWRHSGADGDMGHHLGDRCAGVDNKRMPHMEWEYVLPYSISLCEYEFSRYGF